MICLFIHPPGRYDQICQLPKSKFEVLSISLSFLLLLVLLVRRKERKRGRDIPSNQISKTSSKPMEHPYPPSANYMLQPLYSDIDIDLHIRINSLHAGLYVRKKLRRLGVVEPSDYWSCPDGGGVGLTVLLMLLLEFMVLQEEQRLTDKLIREVDS
jgi:hypothetical protein